MAGLLMKNPERPIAIEHDIKVQGLKNPNYLVIVGFSTTKILDNAMLAVDKSGRYKEITYIVIIEPDLGVFHQTVRREWIRPLAENKRIDMLIGVQPQDLVPHLYNIFSKTDDAAGCRAARAQQPEVIFDPFVYPNTPEGKMHPVVDACAKAVADASNQVFQAMGCASDSFFRWEQTVRNEKNLANCHRIEPLFDKFKEYPVVVLGAGPSLKDFIYYCKEYDLENNSLIIACDAALGLLLENNIKPHIVTRCERKFTSIFKGVTREKTGGVYYAAYPWTDPNYFDLFDNSFMLFRDNGVCKWSGYNPGSVNGGVSSANAALELAYLLNAKEIVLSGVDLCFIGEKSHIDGTEVEFDVEKSKPKWFQIKGNNGELVTTIPVWFRCLNEYCHSIMKHASRNIQVYSTSDKGVRIDGTKFEPWSELKPLFTKKVNPAFKMLGLLEKHNQNYTDTYLANKKKLAEFLKEASSAFEKLNLNIRDLMLIYRREEEKLIQRLSENVNPESFFDIIDQAKKSLSVCIQEPCRLIDSAKQKYFTAGQFSMSVLDICQVDYFIAENKSSSLKNLISNEHERLKQYVNIWMNFILTAKHYCDQMAKLMIDGPNQEVDFKEKIPE